MTQKPLSTRTTKREEFSYILMVLKELLRMLAEDLTKPRNPVRISARNQ